MPNNNGDNSRTMEDYFNKTLSALKKWDNSGSRVLDNGTQLIGKKEHRKPGDMQYLHTLYAPLQSVQIDQLESQIQRKLPDVLRAFYACSNGLSLFNNTFSIQGLRHDYNRDTNDSAWQPVSLEYGTVDRLQPTTNDIICFGFYGWGDGYEIYMSNQSSPEIFLCPQNQVDNILHRWPNFEEMLISEVERLSILFVERNDTVSEPVSLPPPWHE